MVAVGIDDKNFLAYEGDGNLGHAIWPLPVFSIATILNNEGDIEKIPNTNMLNRVDYIFREDSFDPVTRIRRGRIYKASGTQPHRWNVQSHPAYNEAFLSGSLSGFIPKQLNGFHAWPAFSELRRSTPSTQIALGTKDAYTLWLVVNIEHIITGEDLLTLRARSALGVLPELDKNAIPEDGKDKVIEMLDKLSEAAYRSGPESIVDLSRGAAQWCLGVWLANKSGKPEFLQVDLGKLASDLPGDYLISKNLALILARLHSRAKPNEQERYKSRPIREGDAEFALSAVGMLLREIRWAT